MSPIIFMSCDCGRSIHVYVPKEKFFEVEISPSSWQEEYSEKVRAEKFEEGKRFAERVGADYVDAKDIDQITCSSCGRVYTISEIK